MDSQAAYLLELRTRVRRYYAYGEKDGFGKSELKSEIKGFLEAGIKSHLVKTETVKQLIDEEHLSAFGISLEERRARRKLGLEAEPVDWSIYDSPAFERN